MLANAILISFPKCGRTWVRAMVSVVLSEIQRAGFPSPTFSVSHDDDPHWKRPEELERDKSRYAENRVIFMVRDPRDVMVSLFFERTRRIGLYRPEHYAPELRSRVVKYEGDISTFLREPVGSLQTYIEFLNTWASARSVPQRFILLRYEDLHQQQESELNRILEQALGIAVPASLCRHAVEQTSFAKMHEIERSGRMSHIALTPGDPEDPESYKTRRGKVGGFIDYLGPDDIAYIERSVEHSLDPFFRYTFSSTNL